MLLQSTLSRVGWFVFYLISMFPASIHIIFFSSWEATSKVSYTPINPSSQVKKIVNKVGLLERTLFTKNAPVTAFIECIYLQFVTYPVCAMGHTFSCARCLRSPSINQSFNVYLQYTGYVPVFWNVPVVAGIKLVGSFFLFNWLC